MTIHLTPDQEQRIQAVMRRGAYESVEQVVEAALAAVEQRTLPGFAGTQEELDALLLEGGGFQGTLGRRILEYRAQGNRRPAHRP